MDDKMLKIRDKSSTFLRDIRSRKKNCLQTNSTSKVPYLSKIRYSGKVSDKIVNPVDFFKETAVEFKSKGLKRFHFLMPDQKRDVFVTKYSTCGRRICLTKKELMILSQDIEKEIFLPPADFKDSNYSIIKKPLLIKIRWKIWLYKIQAIMPIYNNKKIICLILFEDKFLGSWSNKSRTFLRGIRPRRKNDFQTHSSSQKAARYSGKVRDKYLRYLKNIKPDMEYCLASIFLYNQTLERIIRKYNESN